MGKTVTFYAYLEMVMNMKKTKAPLDWKNLAFEYNKTDFNVRYHWKDGTWSKGEIVSDENIPLHMAAPSLHYGQEAFEGLKAFETKDGRAVVFRPVENSRRLQKSCERIFIPQIPDELFLDAVQKVVNANWKYLPPYGTGASMYIRPLAIGTGARVGLGPASEYLFIMFATPVGPYYKGGFKPVKAMIVEDFDRAAPQGVGDCKVGGNYAAGLGGAHYGKERGYPVVLYLDSREKRYIDEFSTSNFIAIRGNTYLTPKSNSILPSITNDSLSVIARDLGMDVERRPIEATELASFDEVGAVGTAAVITPVNLIRFRDRDYSFGDGEHAGPAITKLYERLTQIQTGDYEDGHGWLYEVK